MDVMQIRRMLMGMMGGSAMVGELTKYQKLEIEETADFNPITVTHTLGVVPKFVQITCPADASIRSVNGAMLEFIGNKNIGCVYAKNSSSGADAFNVYQGIDSGAAINQKFIINDTTVSVPRYGSSYAWKANTKYTVELYA